MRDRADMDGDRRRRDPPRRALVGGGALGRAAPRSGGPRADGRPVRGGHRLAAPRGGRRGALRRRHRRGPAPPGAGPRAARRAGGADLERAALS